MHESSEDRLNQSKSHRAITSAFGLFFIGVAILIALTSDESTRLAALLLAMLIGGLGLEALISAIRSKRSLLSRIGPLP